MLQCLEGFKSLLASLLRCCDLDIYNQSRGLEDPEILARETVCMLLALLHSIDSLIATSIFEKLNYKWILICQHVSDDWEYVLLKYCSFHYSNEFWGNVISGDERELERNSIEDAIVLFVLLITFHTAVWK